MKPTRLVTVAAFFTGLASLHCGPTASAPPDESDSSQYGQGAYGQGAMNSGPGPVPGGYGGYGNYPNYLTGGTGSVGGPPPGGGPVPPGGGPVPPGGGPVSQGGGGSMTGGPGPSPTGTSPGPVVPPAAVDPIGTANRAPGFVNLSPPMGAPLDGVGTTLNPPPPTGWTWYEIAGATCRDGSPTGFYVHTGTADKLVIYLEGGGACSGDHFCAFNPANKDSILAGDGQTMFGSAAGAMAGRQQPGGYSDPTHTAPPNGLFDFANAANPFKDWNQVYVPYCTGDVYFGTNANATVGALPPQKFVGYLNMQKFIGRIVPTFKDKVSHVILTGASAGGFGAALNFSMVSDAFGDVPVDVVDDSGPPFDDKFMFPCMQKYWRTLWGYDAAFPADCAECRQADGAGMMHLADFLMRKHPKARVALISSMQDEIIRLFYSMGLKDCSTITTADPVAIFIGGMDPTIYYPAQQYTDALNDLKSRFVSTGRFATYFIGGANQLNHQHIFRSRFYETAAGTETIAEFVGKFIDGAVEQVGP